jgi:NAD-dependent SIR2 family protein deacetylase
MHLLVIVPLANFNGYKIGAGISVEAGIPDFRSANGLFHRLKQEHPDHGLKSGKDLFDASVFNVGSSHSFLITSTFYHMVVFMTSRS